MELISNDAIILLFLGVPLLISFFQVFLHPIIVYFLISTYLSLTWPFITITPMLVIEGGNMATHKFVIL